MDAVVLFDWDGTLAEWLEPPEQAWRRVLAGSVGAGPSAGEAREAMARAAHRLASEASPGPVPSEELRFRYDALVLEALGLDRVDPEALQPAWSEAEQRFLRVYPESASVLESLRGRGHRLGLIADRVEDLPLRSPAVNRHLESLLWAGEAGAVKPDPRVFQMVLDRMGCLPEEAVHVGDDWADVAGARAAGITPVLVDRRDEHLGADCLRIRDLIGLSDRLRPAVERPVAVHNLVHWLRRQLAQPIPAREHLEAAVANDDPGEVRRLLGAFPFTDAQRRYVEELLDEWERESS